MAARDMSPGVKRARSRGFAREGRRLLGSGGVGRVEVALVNDGPVTLTARPGELRVVAAALRGFRYGDVGQSEGVLNPAPLE